MFKRMIAAVLALGMIFTVPGVSFAAFTVRQGGAIPVGGTVADSVGFGVNVNGDHTLGFNPTLTNPIAIADDSVQVVFKNNIVYPGGETYKSLVISTDNRDAAASPKYTGTLTGSGLVNSVETTSAAPLYWTVWHTETQANNYDGNLATPVVVQKTDGTNLTLASEWPAFDPATSPPEKDAMRTEAERVDSRVHFFITDKKQDLATGFDDPATVPIEHPDPWSPGFGSIVAGVQGTLGTLPNAPVDSTPENATDDYEDFTPLGVIDGNDNFNGGQPRVVDQILDGAGQADVWLKLACDFSGQSAGAYGTSTLRIELVSQTPD